MTKQEAINRLRYRINTASKVIGTGEDGNAFEDIEMAIKALEEQVSNSDNNNYDACDNEYNLINQAIESAKCRIYRLKQNEGSTIAHQVKAKNQQELMNITIKALEYYRDEKFNTNKKSTKKCSIKRFFNRIKRRDKVFSCYPCSDHLHHALEFISDNEPDIAYTEICYALFKAGEELTIEEKHMFEMIRSCK